MKLMREFDVYTEVPIDKVTRELYDSAIDLRWVKPWKTESELRMRLVARGCFQDDEKLDTDTLFAGAGAPVLSHREVYAGSGSCARRVHIIGRYLNSISACGNS